MVTRVLCVAEKNSIAKAVANHLAGRTVQAVCEPFIAVAKLLLTVD
jgi:hypothetical protein